MSYILDNLAPGERIVYRATIHWAIYAFPAVLGAISLFLFLCAACSEPGNGVPLSVCAILFALTALCALLGSWIAAKSTEYAVTDKRVILKTGLFSRRTTELLLHKIEGFTFDEPILGRIFGYGTIHVSGTGGKQDAYPYCTDPMQMRKHVNAQMEALAKAQKVSA